MDLHIIDGAGERGYFSHKQLARGGELFHDVTSGYGPECFAIQGPPRSYPYDIGVHYYSRGPMGYGMGKVDILWHDGQGGLQLDTRAFVVMNDGAYVELGRVTATPTTR